MNGYASDQLPALSSAALFVTINASALAGSWLAARRFLPSGSRTETFLSASVLFSAFVVFTTTLIGATGHLDISCVIAASGIYLGLIALLSLKRIQKTNASSFSFSSIGFIPLAAALVLFVVLVVLLSWAVASPPPPWDAFVYHLRFPAEWIRDGRIHLVTIPYGDQAGTYFPSNTELMYAWLLLPLRSDFLTNALQWFYLFVAMAAAYRIALSIGVSPRASLWCALLGAALPDVLHQTISSEVDIVFAGLLLSTIAFLVSPDDEPNFSHRWLLASMAFGLFLGTKYIACTFAVFLIPFFIFRARKAPVRRFAVLIITALALGGYWYIRNFLLTGNPIFPLSFSIGKFTVFSGGYSRDAMLGSVFHSNIFSDLREILIEQYGIPFLLLFGISFPLYSFMIRRTLSSIYLGLLPPLMILAFWFVIPYNLQGRFLYSAIFVSALYPVAVMDRLKDLPKLFVQVLFLVAILASLTANPFLRQLLASVGTLLHGDAGNQFAAMKTLFVLVLSGAILVSLVVFLSIASHNARIHSVSLPVVLVVAALISLQIAWFGKTHYPDYQYPYYANFSFGRSWLWLSEHLRRPATISFSGTDLCYGLYGPDFRNNVVYTPVTSHNTWFFHDYVRAAVREGRKLDYRTDRINLQRENANYEDWLSNLRRRKVDILYVTVIHPNDLRSMDHDPQGFPAENLWAATHPDVFRLVYSSTFVRIYAIRK